MNFGLFLKIGVSQNNFSNWIFKFSRRREFHYERTRKDVHVFQSARKGREDSSIFNQHVLSSGINPWELNQGANNFLTA